MLKISQTENHSWVKEAIGAIVAALPTTPEWGLRANMAKIMWMVSFESDPIIGSFFRSHEVPPSEAEHRCQVDADRLISGQRAGW